MQNAPFKAGKITGDASQSKQRLRTERRHLNDVARKSARTHATTDAESLAHANSAGSRRSGTLAING
jgi:hypothetical protein